MIQEPGAFVRLLAIMDQLRQEGGCPWDREQTRHSLKPFLIEEAYEVIEAIETGEPDKIKEELGDLLFQIIFHAKISEERGEFSIEDIIKTTAEKMIKRHPHVFAQKKLQNAQEVLIQWEGIKQAENKRSILEGVPAQLPSLLRAHRLQDRAARVGFDWENTGQVLEKVEEEWKEFGAALSEGDQVQMEKEFGDLLFSLVNLARFVHINPEDALRRTIKEFIRCFQHIEKGLEREGKALNEVSLAEMDTLWEEAKKEEK